MRNLLSHAAAAVLVAGLVAGALLLGSGSLPADAQTMPDVAQAPDTLRPLLAGVSSRQHDQQVVRGAEVNGQKMDLDFDLLPGKTLDDAVALYDSRLSTPDAPAMERRLPDGSIYLVTKGAGGALRGVILRQVGGDHPQVVAMPVVARGRIQPGAEASSLDVPMPSARSQVVSYASQDGPRSGVNVDFLSDLDPNALTAWYRTALAEAGWTPAPHSAETVGKGNTRMLRYRRGDQQANVSFKSLKDKGTMVMILETRESAR